MVVVAYLKFVGAVVFPYLHDFYFLEVGGLVGGFFITT